MKKLLLFIVLVSGLPTLGWAGDCSFFSSASCTVGNLEFSNFAWNSMVWAVAPNDMTVVASTGTGGLVSLTFNITEWEALAPELPSVWYESRWDGDITFSVSCASGTNCISGVELPPPGGVGGVMWVSENVISDAFPDFVQLSYPSGATAVLPFPVTSVYVDESFSVYYPFPLYFTDIPSQTFYWPSSVGSAFVTSTTPEPVSMVLMGTFLTMAGGLLRRRKRE